ERRSQSRWFPSVSGHADVLVLAALVACEVARDIALAVSASLEILQPRGDFVDPAVKHLLAAKISILLQRPIDADGWIAEYIAAGRHVGPDPGGSPNDGFGADRDMVGNPGSAADPDTVADRYASRDPNLSADQAVQPDRDVVSDLDLIVDLGTGADPR